MADAVDSKSAAQNNQPLTTKDNTGTQAAVLADCLALLTQKMPDLAEVVAAWPSLPEPVRVGFVTTAKALAAKNGHQ